MGIAVVGVEQHPQGVEERPWRPGAFVVGHPVCDGNPPARLEGSKDSAEEITGRFGAQFVQIARNYGQIKSVGSEVQLSLVARPELILILDSV